MKFLWEIWVEKAEFECGFRFTAEDADQAFYYFEEGMLPHEYANMLENAWLATQTAY